MIGINLYNTYILSKKKRIVQYKYIHTTNVWKQEESNNKQKKGLYYILQINIILFFVKNHLQGKKN